MPLGSLVFAENTPPGTTKLFLLFKLEVGDCAKLLCLLTRVEFFLYNTVTVCYSFNFCNNVEVALIYRFLGAAKSNLSNMNVFPIIFYLSSISCLIKP
jgi:hypothetical protein